MLHFLPYCPSLNPFQLKNPSVFKNLSLIFFLTPEMFMLLIYLGSELYQLFIPLTGDGLSSWHIRFLMKEKQKVRAINFPNH